MKARMYLISFVMLSLASGFLVIFGIQSIQTRENERVQFPNQIKLRNKNNFLFYNNRCVAKISSVFSRKGNSLINKSRGFIRLQANEEKHTGTVNAEIVFNEFDQLVVSILKIKIKSFSLITGTTGINPIVLKVILQKENAKPFNYSISLPGTVRIVKTKPSKFGLRFPMAFNTSVPLVSEGLRKNSNAVTKSFQLRKRNSVERQKRFRCAAYLQVNEFEKNMMGSNIWKLFQSLYLY